MRRPIYGQPHKLRGEEIQEKGSRLLYSPFLVPGAGVEPARVAPLVFETSASTDSAIRASFADANLANLFGFRNFTAEFFTRQNIPKYFLRFFVTKLYTDTSHYYTTLYNHFILQPFAHAKLEINFIT